MGGAASFKLLSQEKVAETDVFHMLHVSCVAAYAVALNAAVCWSWGAGRRGVTDKQEKLSQNLRPMLWPLVLLSAGPGAPDAVA